MKTKLPKIEIYTDGAASNNGRVGAIAGWAWCFLSDDKLIADNCGKLPGGTSNQGELIAIIEALRFLRNNCRNPKHPVTLYSDSSYCVKGINEWIINWKKYDWYRNAQQTAELKNRELWQELDTLKNELNVTFLWVKGHSDNKYNNYVDSLATKMTKEKESGKN